MCQQHKPGCYNAASGYTSTYSHYRFLIVDFDSLILNAPNASTPRLTIVHEPQPTSRFRYAKESKNEGHGYLFASNSNPKIKQPISVQVL